MKTNGFGIYSNSGGGSSSGATTTIPYGVASGTDTYSVTLSPVITSYSTGLLIQVKTTNANTSSTVTIDANSLGAKTVLNANGGVPYIGQFQAGGMYYFTYDGTNLIVTSNPYDGDISSYRITGDTLNRYYCSAITAFAPGTQAQTKDVIRLTPFVVPKQITIDRMAAEITTGGTAASVVRLGIYNSASGLPTTAILNAGTIAGDSATNQTITVSQILPAGLYFLAFIHNSVASITFRSIPFASFGVPSILGISGGSFTGNQSNLIAYGHTYDGTFPDLTGLTGPTAGSNLALIAVRLSA